MMLGKIFVPILVFALLGPFQVTGTGHMSQSGDQAYALGVSALAGQNYTYRDFEQIRAELFQIQSQHPGIAKVYDIGDSWEKTQNVSDHDILAIKISDNVATEEDEPEVLVTALIHAREWISSEIALELAHNLTDNYATDARTSWLVDNREIWIVPVVNPDGLDYALNTDSNWRKNRHLNPDLTYGVDINRNFNGSCNGDPLGEWGGAGSSNLTSSETFRGAGPFSEPETRAIRDLVLSHNFTVAIDFQSWANLVLWPWGYTDNHTADYADLARIGNSLAIEAGYGSQQSILLYPTTGDCIDWMYGGAGVYAFTIEVGDEFHPANATVVSTSIGSNINLALRGIEIAGDRNEKAIDIQSHVPATLPYSPSGYDLEANVTAERGVNPSSVVLRYSLDGVNWTSIAMTRAAANDTYVARIDPMAAVGSDMRYYISARDENGCLGMFPTYSPYYLGHVAIASPQYGVLGDVSYSIPSEVDGSYAWSVSAFAVNYTTGVTMTLNLINTTGIPRDIDVPRISGGHFELTFSPGMPLGLYKAELKAKLLGSTVWNSTRSTIQLSDLTPPSISSNASVITICSCSPRRVDVTVDVYDAYIVSSVTFAYRLESGNWTETHWSRNSSEESRAFPATHVQLRLTVEIGDGSGDVLYTLKASDGNNNIVFYPADGYESVTYGDRYPPDYSGLFLILAVAGMAVAAVALTVLVIRERRRRASGP